MSKVAVIAGGSGLTGTELLHQLCASKAYAQIILLVRKPSGFLHAKVREYVVDFEHLEKASEYIRGDVFFSCLGTTLKKTRNKKEYYHIDHDYVLEMARMASANGMRQFHLVSASNANARSANFYLKIKGETERDVAAVPFAAVHIFRPFVLAGHREQSRFSEKAALVFLSFVKPLLAGPLKKYRSIMVHDVAKAMIRQSLTEQEGVRYYENDEMLRLAQAND